jgi:hypothetical protein
MYLGGLTRQQLTSLRLAADILERSLRKSH